MVLILNLLMLVNVLHLPAQIISASEEDLAKTFKTPPDDAKPWVSMWWFGKITPDDITQHLKELKDKGVGGALMIDLGAMPGVPFLSDPWRGLFAFNQYQYPPGSQCKAAGFRVAGTGESLFGSLIL